MRDFIRVLRQRQSLWGRRSAPAFPGALPEERAPSTRPTSAYRNPNTGGKTTTTTHAHTA